MLGAKRPIDRDGLPRSSRRRFGGAPWAIIAVSAAMVASASCTSRGSEVTPSASAQLAPAEVPEPASVVATFVVRDPDATLAAARKLLGANGGVLASRDTVARLAIDLGMPATTLDLFDGGAPIVGAVTRDGSSGRLAGAFALAVKDVGRLRASTVQGADPAFSIERLGDGDKLVPRRGQSAPLSIGIFGARVVLATDDASLGEVGPFLGARPATDGGSRGAISVRARGPFVASLVGDELRRRVAASPIAARFVVDPSSLLAPLEHAEHVELSLAMSADRATLSAEVPVARGVAPFGLSRGARADVLVAPRGAQVALTMFEAPASRASSAEASSALAGALLDELDAKAVAKSLTDLARARGDRTTLAFEIGPRGPAFFGDLALADAAAADAALGALVEAADARSLRDKVRAAGFKLGVKKTVLERVGDVVRVRVAKIDDAAKGTVAEPPPNIDLFLRVDRARLVLGSGYDAKDALDRALGDEAAIEAAARAPEQLSLALFVDPARLRDPRAPASSLLLSIDADPDAAALRAVLDLDASALGAVVDLGLTR